MLKLYAFHKQANYGDCRSLKRGLDVRSGFKFNAWIQLKGMPTNDAKAKYIELVEKILKHNKNN